MTDDGRKRKDISQTAWPVADAYDAQSHTRLQTNPSNEEAKLDMGLEHLFSSSYGPTNTARGSGEPAPSSKYTEDVERKIVEWRKRPDAIWEQEGRPDGHAEGHWHRASSDLVSEPGTALHTESL